MSREDTERYWLTYGQKALEQLPTKEREAFIMWVGSTEERTQLYIQDISQTIEAFHKDVNVQS